MAREVCELPGFFAPLLMHRVHGTDPMEAAASGSGSMSAPARAPAPVTLAQFRAYWDATLRKYARDEARAFHVLRGDRVVDADAAAAARVRRSTSSTRTSAPCCASFWRATPVWSF